MSVQRIGIIMHGVTGRMGMNQHLIRSILAIRAQGGVVLGDGTGIVPDPILVGRRPGALEALAAAHGIDRWSTDLDAVLGDKGYELFFDAAFGPGCWSAPSPPASTSTAKNRLPTGWTMRSGWRTSRTRPASSTASSRTSCGCPAS